MKKAYTPRNQENSPLSLPLQTSLHHRGGFGSNTALLYPPAGTLEALGGKEAVAKLVDGLYDRFETDSVLRPAFSRDLTHERERVKLFFEAWFGGSRAYFDTDWPPGLTAAHGPISISRAMAGRWVGHFLDTLAEVVTDPFLIAQIKPLIARMAMGLVNRVDEPVPGERLRGGAYSADPRFLHCVQKDDADALMELAAAHPRVLPSQGPRLLLVAAVRGKPKAAEALLHQGVDPNAVAMLQGSEASACGLPMLRITPLCGALAKHRVEVAKLLIEKGAQYDIFSAAFVGDVEGVRKLLDSAPELANSDDPACDVAQITPLMHAVMTEQFEVAQLLMQRGATVGANSIRLVRAAANRGNEALTDLLIQQAASPASIGAGTWVGYPSLAEKLLAHGANVNEEPGVWIKISCTGNSGNKENAMLVRALLRCGAETAALYKGNTALHCAAKAGFAQVVAALIEHGAYVNALNDQGQTPLDAVERAGKSIDREPLRQLLIAYGARRSRV